MFSDSRIQELAKEFVCVKVDPRERGVDRTPFRYKSTRYVPEVVILSSEGEVLGRIEEHTAAGVAAKMETALGCRR